MSGEVFSAVGAMSALRGQIEDRLLQTEDYRAMKALDRAIAEVRSQPKAEGLPAATMLQSSTTSMSGSMPSYSGNIAEVQANLQQKLSEKMNAAAA